ncbi:MAG: restriction endonuclease subunit S, partial [Phocaeicola sp.]
MKIRDIVSLKTSSVNPMDKPETHWFLYSLPSFDEGKQREVILGSDIQSNKYIVPNKCILFNKLNVRFKRIWQVDNQDEDKICSTEFLPLVVDERIADFNFIYYLLCSEMITSYLSGQNSNTSSSHKRIDPNNFLDIEVNLPSIAAQRKIGSILANLDSKIATNIAINQNLEAMAKQLYDYWFVQFDFPDENGKPYKSSGGKMVWSEKLKRE